MLPKRLPKHLREMEASALERVQRGINAFIFGFAPVGAVNAEHRVKFLGNFGKRHEAQQTAKELGGTVRPYQHGRLPGSGWVVWKPARPGELSHDAALIAARCQDKPGSVTLWPADPSAPPLTVCDAKVQDGKVVLTILQPEIDHVLHVLDSVEAV